MAGTKQIDTLFNKVLHQRDYLKCPYDYGDFNDDPGDPDYGKPPDYDVEFYPTSDYDTSHDEVYNENYYKDQIGKEIYEYTKKLIHKLSDKIDSIERTLVDFNYNDWIRFKKKLKKEVSNSYQS